MKNQDIINRILKTKKELESIYRSLTKIVKYNTQVVPGLSQNEVRRSYNEKTPIKVVSSVLITPKKPLPFVSIKKSTTPEPKRLRLSFGKIKRQTRSSKPKKIYKTSEATICLLSDQAKSLIPKFKNKY